MRKNFLFSIALFFSLSSLAQNEENNKFVINGYLNELSTLNEYLRYNNWKSGYYGKVEVKDSTIEISYDRKVNYSFKVSEKVFALVNENNHVILKCSNGNKCIYNYETNQQADFVSIEEKNQKRNTNNKIAELFNALINAVSNKSSKYAETPLESSVAKLNEFLDGKKAASFTDGSYSYFDKVYMENRSRLRFDYLGSSYEVINLEWVNEIYIKDISKEKPVLMVTSAEDKSYCCSNYEGRAYDYTLWAQLSNTNCKKFYVLLGNVLNAYRSANDKHYKVEQTYQDRVDLMNAPSFLEKIERGSVIRVDDIFKKTKNYKKLNYKKIKGQEVEVTYLDIDHSYQTYNGKILVNNVEYNVEELKLTFIKDKDGNDLTTYKAKLEGGVKKEEQEVNEKDNFTKTQWHPVSKLLHQFVEDAKKANGLAKYAKEGNKDTYQKANSNYTNYQIAKYKKYTKCVEWIDFAYTTTPNHQTKFGSYFSVWFPKEYLENYLDFLKYQAPILKTEKNSDKIFWVEKTDKQGLVLYYRDFILMILDTSTLSNPKETLCVLYIFEYVE